MKSFIAVGLLWTVACGSSPEAPPSAGASHDASETDEGAAPARVGTPEASAGQSAVDASDATKTSPESGGAEAGAEWQGRADGQLGADAPFADASAAGAGGDAAAESAGPHTFDGTSGKACASNADCGTINICTISYSGKLSTLNGVASPQFWPTPLCMVPLPTAAGVGNCNPGPANFIEFCDSANPTDPASPGICLPLTTPQQSGPTNGFCFPHCTFASDGSPAVGCPGKDTCVPVGFLLDPASDTLVGHGYCDGTCQVDTDCSDLGAGWVCQADDGYCTKAKKTRTKALGAICTNSGNGATPLATIDSETGACNCPFSGTTFTSFYCSSACVVGGVACPTGYVCDALQPTGVIDFPGAAADGGDLVLAAPTKQNPGLAGTCLASCTSADAARAQCPGSASVPPISTCTAPTDMGGTPVGPDCLP